MFASGFAGLGYQIAWTQQCGVWLGHESAAVLAVVAAFFGGLSLGALGVGSRIERSTEPARWYAGGELVIAAYGALLAFLLPSYGSWVLGLIGVEPAPLRQWSVAFFATFVLLLPATAAMGATLPAMERIASGWRGERRSIGLLYASNTFGAVVGVLSTACYLTERLGLTRTSLPTGTSACTRA